MSDILQLQIRPNPLYRDLFQFDSEIEFEFFYEYESRVGIELISVIKNERYQSQIFTLHIIQYLLMSQLPNYLHGNKYSTVMFVIHSNWKEKKIRKVMDSCITGK